MTPVFNAATDAPAAGMDEAPLRTVGRTTRQSSPATSRGRLSRAAVSLILFAGDAAAYVLAYAAVAPLTGRLAGTVEIRMLALAALATMLLYASDRLYPGYRLYGHEQIRRRAVASFKVALVAAAGAGAFFGSWPLAFLLVGFLAIALILQPVVNPLAQGLCRAIGLWGERAAILAEGDRVEWAVEHFRRHWQYGIRPEGWRADAPEMPAVALLAGPAVPTPEQMAALRRQFSEIILLADTPGRKLSGLQPADHRGEIGLPLVAGRSADGAELVRRVLDLAVAVPATILSAPVVALAAASIYAIDPGPVFFTQPREGRGGRTVRVLKLRTMYQDAEARLEALFRENPALKSEWETHFKLKRDPRILPVVGHILRSSSCDELPQLVNVVLGQMSLVGPRPFPEYHLLAMNAEFRHKRRSVIPGITGLWQISERSNADLDLQCQLDEFYIDNRSRWLDWHILLSTIPAVFKRGGAY